MLVLLGLGLVRVSVRVTVRGRPAGRQADRQVVLVSVVSVS